MVTVDKTDLGLSEMARLVAGFKFGCLMVFDGTNHVAAAARNRNICRHVDFAMDGKVCKMLTFYAF